MKIPNQLVTVSYIPDANVLVLPTSELLPRDLVLIKRPEKRPLEDGVDFYSLSPKRKASIVYEARWRRVVHVKLGGAIAKLRGHYADGTPCWRDYLKTEEWYVVRERR